MIVSRPPRSLELYADASPRHPDAQPPQSLTVQNDRVRIYPSANGTVLVVGVTADGEWVCEYRCLAVDFDEAIIEGIERRVHLNERRMVRAI